MKRIAFTLALLLAAVQVHAAGVWYGSTSDLSATVSSTAHSYPTLLCAWIECNESPDDDCVIALSDNDASGSLDSLELRVEGDTLKGWAKASGGGSAATQSGLPATGRVFVAAVFDSTTSRRVKIGTGSWSTTSTTSRAPGNFTRVSIGSLHSNGVTASFDGPITSASIWRGIDADNVDLLVDQLARGVDPDKVWHVSPYMYQPLVSGINESTKVGATLTATAIDFTQDIQDDYDNELITTEQYNTRRALALFYKADSRHSGNPQFGDLVLSQFEPVNDGFYPFRWPDDVSSPGPIPTRRVVKVGSDSKITLAGASDSKWIGATVSGRPGMPAASDASTCWMQMVRLRDGGRLIEVDEVNSPSWTIGTSEAFLAVDGKCDDSGTVAIGLVVASAGGVATISPY